MYDFSLSAGDTLNLYEPENPLSTFTGISKIPIDSVGNTNFNGVSVRTFYMGNVPDFAYGIGGVVYENFGSQNWILPRPTIWILYDGPLHCYQDSTLDVHFDYLNDTTACDYVKPPMTFGLLENQNSGNFSLYPNPNTGTFVLKMDNSTPIEARIYDLKGRVVWQETTVGSCEIHTNLPTGMYVVEIPELAWRKKMVVE